MSGFGSQPVTSQLETFIIVRCYSLSLLQVCVEGGGRGGSAGSLGLALESTSEKPHTHTAHVCLSVMSFWFW